MTLIRETLVSCDKNYKGNETLKEFMATNKKFYEVDKLFEEICGVSKMLEEEKEMKASQFMEKF